MKYEGVVSELFASGDSDWAGGVQSRKSTGGCTVSFKGGFNCWCSFQQRCVAARSTESEYVALSECNQKVCYHSRTSKELYESAERTVVYEDNHHCITCATKDGRRNKHVDVRYHIFREPVENRVVKLEYCPTMEMVADILSEPLRPQKI